MLHAASGTHMAWALRQARVQVLRHIARHVHQRVLHVQVFRLLQPFDNQLGVAQGSVSAQ